MPFGSAPRTCRFCVATATATAIEGWSRPKWPYMCTGSRGAVREMKSVPTEQEVRVLR